MHLKLLLLLVAINFQLSALSPRLLIKLPSDIQFPLPDLATQLNAPIITAENDTILAEQINKLDFSQETHFIIIESPIENIKKLAQYVGYDFLLLNNSTIENALETIKAKAATIPLTDDCLPRIDALIAGQLYDLMMKVDTIFKDNHLTYWATSGTLLGAIRHQGLIPWDDDLDIAMFTHDIPKLLALKQELCDAGLAIAMHPSGWYKIYPINGKKIKVAEQYKKTYNQEYFDWTYPSVDIFPMQLTRDNIIRHSYLARQYWPKEYYLPQELLAPFEQLRFGPMNIPVPHDYFTIIERIYGADWNKITYINYDHQNELPVKKIKVQLTDRSQTPYVLPL